MMLYVLSLADITLSSDIVTLSPAVYVTAFSSSCAIAFPSSSNPTTCPLVPVILSCLPSLSLPISIIIWSYTLGDGGVGSDPSVAPLRIVPTYAQIVGSTLSSSVSSVSVPATPLTPTKSSVLSVCKTSHGILHMLLSSSSMAIVTPSALNTTVLLSSFQSSENTN